MLKSGLYSLLLTAVSSLQAAGPPASLLQGERALIGKRRFFARGTLKGWTKKEYHPPLMWFFLQALFKQEAFLPCDSFKFGSRTQSPYFESPIRLYSAEKRSHVSVVKPAGFFRSKAKTGFWNTSSAKCVTRILAVCKCGTVYFKILLHRHRNPC